MPLRLDPASDRSIAQLDLSPAKSGIFTPGIEAIEITDAEVARFNALAHSLNEAMPPLSADQLAGVARRVLRTAASGGESPFDPQSFLDDCYARGDAAACARVQRGADGTLASVRAMQWNQPGGLEVEGYDLSLAYATETRIGAFKLRWDAAYLSYFGELGRPQRGTLLADGSIADGNIVGNAVNWRLRSVLKLDWKRGAWDATAALRYFSPLIEDCQFVVTTADTVGDPSLYSLCSDPDRRVDGNLAPANRIASVTYVDLEAGWSTAWKGRFSIGVRNAFDRDPPVSYSATEFSTNFIPDYDLPGRWWFVSYRQAF